MVQKGDIPFLIEVLAERFRRLEASEGSESRKGEKQKLGKQKLATIQVYQRLVKERDAQREAYLHPKKPAEIVVGKCECGADIRIGETYRLSLKTNTRISRACTGCTRTNLVEVGTNAYAARMTFGIYDCFCGETLYAPDHLRYAPSSRQFGTTKKVTRKYAVPCRRCGCKWTFDIVNTIEPDENGKEAIYRKTGVVVKACYGCKNSEKYKTKFTPVERKGKKSGS